MAAPAAAAPGTQIPRPASTPRPHRVSDRLNPGLTLNLSSNNPFRNRLSTASVSPRSPDANAQSYPFPGMSNNPFLDPADAGAPRNQAPSPKKTATQPNGDGAAMADDLFKDLSLLDKPASNGSLPSRGQQPRSGTLQPHQSRPQGPEDRRGPPRGPPREGISPPKRPQHRRRASETSVMEKERQDRRERQRERGERPPRTESEERRRRERRKEREERYKREGRDPNGHRTRKQRNLDLIDKLDVTGIYGQGLIHHDGPFDACNPHRNVKRDRRAPMQAFPEGSANMAMGGAGPLNSRLNLDQFHGRGDEGFQDYGRTRKNDTYVNPTERTEQIHGEASYGLGTSTFLEGAPVSKRTMERRESEERTTMAEQNTAGGGLQRKRSLAQRLRGMSASQRRPGHGGVRSPDARYHPTSDPLDSPSTQTKAVSAGGHARTHFTKENEINPFDNAYDDAFEKKGTKIQFAEQEKPTSPRLAPTNNNDLTRSVTADSAARSSAGEEDRNLAVPAAGGGFLNRMKSLKGGRRTRPTRKDSNSVVPTS